ncbi:MAG: type I secretion protein [Rhodobacteraceae bacterium]|nr:type I secretion protein [Paracoccaceae bacterium]
MSDGTGVTKDDKTYWGAGGTGTGGTGTCGTGTGGTGTGGTKTAGPVDGTSGDDIMLPGYVDDQCDTIDGADGDNDVIYAYAGNDIVDAGKGDDTVYGGNGNDTIAGGPGSNMLYGGNGDDVFVGGSGADTFEGGAGQDNLDYSNSDSAVTVDLSTGSLSGGDADNDSITSGIDGVIGSDFDDTLIGFDQEGNSSSDTFTNEFFGGKGDDYIEGKGGDDRLFGGEDDDEIYGGGGADIIEGGEGVDNLFGGADRDTFNYSSAEEAIGDHVDGGSAGDDCDTLDLSNVGHYKIINQTVDADGNSTSGTVQFIDHPGGSVTGEMTFTEIENILDTTPPPCFTPGTLIATMQGEKPVEMLKVGDRVITRDNGAQEIRWIGAKPMTGMELQANPHLQPVLIRKGALGNGLPERDMLVSQNHRLLVNNAEVGLLFNEPEVLVAAKHMVNDDKGISLVSASQATYVHFMFDHHEVVLSDGAWTESFQPGDQAMASVTAEQRDEITELFPELACAQGREAYTSSRLSLKAFEAKMFK